MAAKSQPNGTATPTLADGHQATSNLPPVVGINYGNSYASIAVFTKEGLAECIANEDGERQIASAISFHGEETYIGNPAKHQLVKNASNTIVGFRNLLGKKFSEIPQSANLTSAPVIQHPTIPDEPAYKVQVLQPAPSPIPPSTAATISTATTPLASQLATPRSEPIPAERILTVSEVNTIFIKSLVQSAEDFLGKKIQGAVISVPSWFTDAQKDALERAANDAGVKVLQLLDEAAAVAGTTTASTWTNSGASSRQDRNQLVVDLGSSSLSLNLLSIRQGLAFSLASSSTTTIGADQIDDKLIKFFAAEFTKKTKVPLSVAPSTDAADKRAEAKLRLAIEHTKRTISASPGAATCSVESLKDGLDFTGSINRMRFDLVARPIYGAVAGAVADLLAQAGVDAYDVDEVVYVGGSGCLPGLDEQVVTGGGLREGVETPFLAGTVVGGGIGDPTTILARGCAIQAALLHALEDEDLRKAYERNGGEKLNEVVATSKTIGLVFPDEAVKEYEVGGTWVPLVLKETPLPVRTTVRFDVSLTEESKKVGLELWEVEEGVRVEKVKPPKLDDEDGEDAQEEEEEEEIEVKHQIVNKKTLLGASVFDATQGIKIKGKSKDAGKWYTSVEVSVVVGLNGGVALSLSEVGAKESSVKLEVAPSAS